MDYRTRISGKHWKPLHVTVNMYFNHIYVKNTNDVLRYTNAIARLYRVIKRIVNSKNTYLNDDAIIEEKKVNIKNLREKRSKAKNVNKKLLKYHMTEREINDLVRYTNREIISEVLLGKYYNIPYNMGKLTLKYVSANSGQSLGLAVVHWPKSMINHLRLTKKYAPIIHDKFINQQTITKKEYFAMSKPFVAPIVSNRVWLHFVERRDWLYLSWIPNYAYVNKHKHPYRFKFTAFNHEPRETDALDATTAETLKNLDTPEKILNSEWLGNINKCILLQLQNDNYITKITDI